MVDHIEVAERVFASEEMRGVYDRLQTETEQEEFEQEPMRPVALEEAAAREVGEPRAEVLASTTSGDAAVRDRNLYERLGLDPSDATEVILAQLRDQLKPSWQARASRAGQVGQQAREKLADIAHAEEVFATEASRADYDREIRKQPQGRVEEARIDWQGMAWNYYFKNDMGAASVAARKAREQEPDSPLPYVVSAWVELAEGGEIRRAKDNADEAFVLDELGEDSVDVHHVRGAVFFMLDQWDRAMESFDRALGKANDYEAVEIWMRKAWTYEAKGDVPGMVAACVRALSIPVDQTKTLRQRLEETARRAFTRKCLTDDTAESIRLYSETASGLRTSAVQEPSKTHLLGFLDGRVLVTRELRDLELRCADLEATKAPDGSQADLPLISLGAGLLSLLLASQFIIFLLVGLVLLGRAGYVFLRRSEWSTQCDAYSNAMQELGTLHPQIDQMRRQARALAGS